jgi:hypothetical protein
MAVWKVRGLILLLRVGPVWRCGDGLFFGVPPLVSDALHTTLHPLLGNVLQTVDHFEISCLGAPFSWLQNPRNRMRRDLNCMADVLRGFHRSTFSKPNTEFNSDLVHYQLHCPFWKLISEFDLGSQSIPRRINTYSGTCRKMVGKIMLL